MIVLNTGHGSAGNSAGGGAGWLSSGASADAEGGVRFLKMILGSSGLFRGIMSAMKSKS